MKILECEDKDFPKSLLKIKNSPKRLWVQGNAEILNKKAISIVGSRKCSEYGKKWCEKFTKDLLEYDLVIVSGMAIGIDKIAHETALKYGGKTIAVLPSGFENIYPKENLKLYKDIIENDGAVVTEYSPEIKASKEKFLERNRIVSGLGIGTLVIEAAYRSGTSVTANITKNEGKMVFCIPGSLDNSKSVGTNALIQRGAKLVQCVEDIVSNYNFLNKEFDFSQVETKLDDFKDIDEEYRDLYKIICKGPISINILAKQAKISINEAISKISMLEIEGKIERNERQEICIVKNK